MHLQLLVSEGLLDQVVTEYKRARALTGTSQGGAHSKVWSTLHTEIEKVGQRMPGGAMMDAV